MKDEEQQLAETKAETEPYEGESSDFDFEEIYLDEPERDEHETEEFGEDDFDEEAPRFKAWMLPLILVVMLLAVLICIPLWRLTDNLSGGKDEPSRSTLVAEGSGQDMAGGSGNATEPASTASPEPTATPMPTATPEPTTSPEPTTAPVATEAPVPAASPVPTEAPAATPAQGYTSGDSTMTFTAVSDTVTAKNVTNLRSEPTTTNSGNVVAKLRNGQSISRVGMNTDTGWSKLEYNGQTVYAVSQYLTTDLGYETPPEPAAQSRVTTQDGRVMHFVDCSDNITPKEYVNLRTEPSTTEGDTTVRCQISEGEVVHRTGYCADSGWSRVEYNGEVLYVVSSYMEVVE